METKDFITAHNAIKKELNTEKEISGELQKSNKWFKLGMLFALALDFFGRSFILFILLLWLGPILELPKIGYFESFGIVVAFTVLMQGINIYQLFKK